MTPIDHTHNLNIVREFTSRITRELEEVNKAEIGGCAYRAHVDAGHLHGMIAISTGLLAMCAILSENLEVMKLVGTIVVHPKEAPGEPDPKA